jgi:hypothetical protein
MAKVSKTLDMMLGNHLDAHIMGKTGPHPDLPSSFMRFILRWIRVLDAKLLVLCHRNLNNLNQLFYQTTLGTRSAFSGSHVALTPLVLLLECK